VIDRRLEQLRGEGVKFRTSVFVGDKAPGKAIVSDARESISPKKIIE
jgi:glutamate synthase (NADPH/NADH) small chain